MSLISFYFTSFVYGKTFSLYVVLIRQRRADSTDCVFISFFFISIQIYYNAKLTKAALSLLDQVKHYAAAHFLQRSVAVLL